MHHLSTGGDQPNMDEQIVDDDYGAFVQAAVSLARTIDGLDEQGEILSSAADIYAGSGELDLAVNLAQTIDDAYQEIWRSQKLRRSVPRTATATRPTAFWK
jgi:hypothetical protein